MLLSSQWPKIVLPSVTKYLRRMQNVDNNVENVVEPKDHTCNVYSSGISCSIYKWRVIHSMPEHNKWYPQMSTIESFFLSIYSNVSSINSWTMKVRSRNSEKKNDQTAKNAGCVINNISQVALRSSSSKRSTLHRMNERRTKLYSSAELFSHPTARRSRQTKKGQYKIDCSAWLHGSYSAHRHCHERCENVEKLAIGTSITSVQ